MKDYVLYVYRAPSGQVSGAILDGDQEVCGIAGCASLEEVEEAAIEAGYQSYKLFIPIPLA
jgi:hypothetical protein